jgi:hypothetical protein
MHATQQTLYRSTLLIQAETLHGIVSIYLPGKTSGVSSRDATLRFVLTGPCSLGPRPCKESDIYIN